ncbi:hypothetical protein FOZ63_018195, partial [Perkinsus olseni]
MSISKVEADAQGVKEVKADSADELFEDARYDLGVLSNLLVEIETMRSVGEGVPEEKVYEVLMQLQKIRRNHRQLRAVAMADEEAINLAVKSQMHEAIMAREKAAFRGSLYEQVISATEHPVMNDMSKLAEGMGKTFPSTKSFDEIDRNLAAELKARQELEGTLDGLCSQREESAKDLESREKLHKLVDQRLDELQKVVNPLMKAFGTEQPQPQQQPQQHTWTMAKSILILGDGDFSFSASLAEALLSPDDEERRLPVLSLYLGLHPDTSTIRLLCTSFDTREDLDKKYGRAVEANLKILQDYNISVQHGIDAVRLPEGMRGELFDVIIWNHPHLGVEDAKLHQVLMAHFADSARRVLRSDGRVLLCLVEGQAKRWNLANLASLNGLHLIGKPRPFPTFKNHQTQRQWVPAGNDAEVESMFSTLY